MPGRQGNGFRVIAVHKSGMRIGRLASADTADHVRGIGGRITPPGSTSAQASVSATVAPSGLELRSARTRASHPAYPSTPARSSAPTALLVIGVHRFARSSVGLDWVQMGFFASPAARVVGRLSPSDLAEELITAPGRTGWVLAVAAIRRRQVGGRQLRQACREAGSTMSDDGRTRLIKDVGAHKEAPRSLAIRLAVGSTGQPDRCGATLGPQATLLRTAICRGDRCQGATPVLVLPLNTRSDVLVTYDIADTEGIRASRRKRIADVCGKYGQRVRSSRSSSVGSPLRGLARLIGEIELTSSTASTRFGDRGSLRRPNRRRHAYAFGRQVIESRTRSALDALISICEPAGASSRRRIAVFNAIARSKSFAGCRATESPDRPLNRTVRSRTTSVA